MKWWPFGKGAKSPPKYDSEIHIKGTRVWLQNLQEICEKNFDSPTNGKRLIREMQVEWKDAAKRKEIDEKKDLRKKLIKLGLKRSEIFCWKKAASKLSKIFNN